MRAGLCVLDNNCRKGWCWVIIGCLSYKHGDGGSLLLSCVCRVCCKAKEKKHGGCLHWLTVNTKNKQRQRHTTRCRKHTTTQTLLLFSLLLLVLFFIIIIISSRKALMSVFIIANKVMIKLFIIMTFANIFWEVGCLCFGPFATPRLVSWFCMLWTLEQMNINNLKGVDLLYSLFHCSLLPSTGFRRACTHARGTHGAAHKMVTHLSERQCEFFLFIFLFMCFDVTSQRIKDFVDRCSLSPVFWCSNNQDVCWAQTVKIMNW